MRIYFLFFLLLGNSFCAIYSNSPNAGEPFQILIEGAQNSSITLISPSGQRHEVFLHSGQATFYADEAGDWEIEYGKEQKTIFVAQKAPPALSSPLQQSKASPDIFLFASFAVLAIIAAAAAGIAVFIHPDFSKKPAHLCKKRSGNIVSVLFAAGSQPAKEVLISDSAGPDWGHETLRMRSKKLEGLQKLQMQYEYAGKIGGMKASWLEEGKIKSLFLEGEGEVFDFEREGFSILEKPLDSRQDQLSAKKRVLEKSESAQDAPSAKKRLSRI